MGLTLGMGTAPAKLSYMEAALNKQFYCRVQLNKQGRNKVVLYQKVLKYCTAKVGARASP